MPILAREAKIYGVTIRGVDALDITTKEIPPHFDGNVPTLLYYHNGTMVGWREGYYGVTGLDSFLSNVKN